MKPDRNLVDTVHVGRRDHTIFLNVTEVRNFRFHFLLERAIGSAQQNIRLNSEAGQFLNAMLRWFRFDLGGGADERHQRDMRVDDILFAEVPSKLADRFEERQTLDIAYGAADFDDQNIATLGREQDTPFDLVGDMRNYLDRRAEIIAASLLLNHGVVDLSGGAVVAFAHPGFDEALVMPEIEVGFRTVIGDENFAVLQRAHGAGIDVDVGVHFQERDA